MPIFTLGVEEFILALVSFPVYIIIPMIFWEATTVLAHIVFSKFNGSFLTSPSTVLHLTTPSKLYINLEGGSHSATFPFEK